MTGWAKDQCATAVLAKMQHNVTSCGSHVAMCAAAAAAVAVVAWLDLLGHHISHYHGKRLCRVGQIMLNCFLPNMLFQYAQNCTNYV